MMLKVISNASPLIALTGINLLHILNDLWKEIIIPEAVYKEVVTNGEEKPGVGAIKSACKSWIKVVSARNKQEIDALRAILDDGEAEVITLGQELSADLLLLDNREPRLFATSVNLKVMGTIGVIRLAWQRGLVEDPVKEIYRLRFNGFWISDKLIEQIKLDIGI
ncbi:MAG: DUF3368 domain-containing protein [Planctomycetia bacterium]|nr:DUF3368 domain-containing protein [Planctomycetia bacterium]